MGSALKYAYRRTDMMELKIAFHHRANAPKRLQFRVHPVRISTGLSDLLTWLLVANYVTL
jgi:hypothetical protein